MLTSRRLTLTALMSGLLLMLMAVTAGPVAAADTPDYSTVKINEVATNPNPDFVELVNTGTDSVDISQLTVADSDHPAVTFAPGTTIPPGGHFSFNPDTLTGGFGLGAADAVTIYQSDGTTVVDTYAWTTHRTPSYARCPEGTGDFVVSTVATPGAANDCPAPDPASIKINEVATNPNPDFVELINTGNRPIDISGWKVADSDHPAVAFAADTTIQPGDYFSFNPDSITGGFGLGSADAVTIYLPDGTTVIDTYAWTTHRTPSYARCPAGTGDFLATTEATPGAANICPVPPGAADIKINEVESDPNDLIELTNLGDAAVDISGYLLKDNDDSHVFPIPAGTTLGGGAYASFDVNASFGLGKGDSARLYAPGGETLLDSTTWPADTHAVTWGRCPDGTGEFEATSPTLGSANVCGGAPSYTFVRINEVESNGDKVADWVELTNTGTVTVDISGWKILDNDAGHVATPVVVPAGTTIAPGGFHAIYTEIGQSPGFGLGGADSATVYRADGTTVVDTYAWTTHAATTYGRCPDGTGDFKTTTTSTRGAGNACSPVRINEVESSDATNPDFVELTNISDAPVDVSGWVIKDSGDADAYTFPAGTTVPAHGHTIVEAGPSGLAFGLGAADSVRLFGADGTTAVESYAWTTHAAVSYGRCKDGIGDFVDTTAVTRGAANSCPGLATEPWPGDHTIRTADLAGTFVQDLSGLAFDPSDPDVLWAAQNKAGTLFRLVRNGENWTPDTANSWGAGKAPKYTDGTGAPDTEGLTIGPDGAVYMASERNNSASGVSRMSVLRYDPGAAGSTLTATDEWNLTSQIPAAGANLGLEGVAWVPDTYLVANGFVDQSTGGAYAPADYPLHGTGLYVVAVEDTGSLHAFALDSTGGTSHRVATIASGFAHLADVSFDPERQRVWAVTDDTHDGRTSQLKIQDGAFVVDTAYDRPAAMPNLNNEGLAISAQSECVDGKKEVVWSDDGDADGHSLRTGTIACTSSAAAQDVTFTSTAPDSPVVGQTYAATATGGGSGNPVVLSASPSSVCTIDGATVTLAHTGTCTVTAEQAAAPGYLAGSASQEITVGRAATSTSVAVSPPAVTATVEVVAPGAGTPTGNVEFRVGASIIGTATLSDGVATLSEVVPSGADRQVTAVYDGADDFAGSEDSLVRQDPLITATVAGTLSASGWYTSPVTVTFDCTPQGAPLVDACPEAASLSKDGSGQAVTRTITATDGGRATATADGIRIDRTKPRVAIASVVKNRLYAGPAPKARCVAYDTTSGVASCVLTRKVTPKRTTLTATAVDKAGNVNTTKVSYRTLAYVVKGATYRHGEFMVQRGKAYSLVGTVKAPGRVYGPARFGTTARAAQRLTNGRATVRIPRSAKPGSHWKILVKSGSKTYYVKMLVKK